MARKEPKSDTRCAAEAVDKTPKGSNVFRVDMYPNPMSASPHDIVYTMAVRGRSTALGAAVRRALSEKQPEDTIEVALGLASHRGAPCLYRVWIRSGMTGQVYFEAVVRSDEELKGRLSA